MKRKIDDDDLILPPAKRQKIEKNQIRISSFFEVLPELKCLEQGILPSCFYETVLELLIPNINKQEDAHLVDDLENAKKDSEQLKKAIKFENNNRRLNLFSKWAPTTEYPKQNLQWKDLFGCIFPYVSSIKFLMKYRLICKTAYDAIHDLQMLPWFLNWYQFHSYFLFPTIKYSNLRVFHYLIAYFRGYLGKKDISVKEQTHFKNIQLFYSELCSILSNAHYKYQVINIYLKCMIPLIGEYLGNEWDLTIHYPLCSKALEDAPFSVFEECDYTKFKDLDIVFKHTMKLSDQDKKKLESNIPTNLWYQKEKCFTIEYEDDSSIDSDDDNDDDD